MIRMFDESNDKMTLDDLAKKVAECFNNEIIENNCSDFEDLKFMMQMTSSDIKEEIVWNLYDFTKGTGFKVFDSGNIHTPDGENVPYRKFRNMVFKYVKKNPNYSDDENEK